MRGLADPPPDEAGREQARRLGTALGPRSPSLVVASPLRRAIQTAQPSPALAAFRPDLGEPGTLGQDNSCFNTLERQDGTWAVLAVNEVPPGH